ncbi:MAG: hypothetical protein JWL59_2837 [Chthoniobacteraceae bacterium]|nr:hypothetical protein [Chthoniobacteraceae bacterium]
MACTAAGCRLQIVHPASRFVLFFIRIAFGIALAFAVAANAADVFEEQLRPILDANCFQCHGGKKQKGGVELASFFNQESVIKKYKLWRNVLQQVETNEMPPEDEKVSLSEGDRAKLVAGLKQTLALLESDHPLLLDPGPGPIRRLSRAEYGNTIRDLIGIEFDAGKEVGMPEDNTGTGYANLASALIIPRAAMEKYFMAADAILARLYSDPDVKTPDKRRDQAAFKALFSNATADRAAAETLIRQFLRRAYRRPVAQSEVERALKVFDTSAAKGDPFPLAIRRVLKPILVSPSFLFRIEEDQPDQTGPVSASRVSDVELASRLSYFLWASMPDEPLLALAESNSLSQVLEAQVKRMLADPRAEALTENFTLKWLQLERLAAARPSTEFFPTFNDKLKRAMKEEVTTFCDHLRADDRSILELLDADYTFANEELGKLYGLQSVAGKEFQRVTLKPEDHRGGVLGMAGILTETSHTNRTSPTQRGKWVLEVIFGTPPAPPPPDAGMFKDEKKSKEPKDFREKLAQHASDAVCAGCHRKLDPLGFGLDNYDAIGAWRPTSAALNTGGELPGGEKFSGATELRQILWKRRDEFERNFVSQLLTYGLGRELDYFDVRTVSKIKARLDQEGHQFSTLVLGIVNSYPFLNRRPAEPAATALLR